jgi:DNA-binding NtrC family response regulator
MASLLIVDDNEQFAEVLVDLFSGEHLCQSVGTAEDALKQIKARDYDVIITAMAMPGLSGEDLLGLIRIYHPRTPVIFISGASDSVDADRLMRKGAFDYLTKPFRFDELKERVARALLT